MRINLTKTGSERSNGKKVRKLLKYTVPRTEKVTEVNRIQSQTEGNGNNHTNRPVRTARAVVQHHNATMCITMHNTQRQFCYSTPASRPSSHLRYVH